MKKETITEAAERLYPNLNQFEEFYGDINEFSKKVFLQGAEWQQKRMYSDEDINKLISDFKHDLKESTSNFVKQNCEGAIFSLERLKEFKKK